MVEAKAHWIVCGCGGAFVIAADRFLWTSVRHQSRSAGRRQQVGQLDGTKLATGQFRDVPQGRFQLRFRSVGKPLVDGQHRGHRAIDGFDHLEQGNVGRTPRRQ